MRIFGHRGARGLLPENTLPSIQKAIDLGAPWIEIDVHACASGELVVIHDLTVDRTTNGSGAVAQLDLAALQALDAGGCAPVPTLAEVLDLCAGRASLNIELKGAGIAAALAAQLDAATASGAWQAIELLVSSFDHAQLGQLRDLAPHIPRGALICGVPHDLAACADAVGAVALHASADFLPAQLIDDARRRELAVYAYTVNDPAWLGHHDVDGVFTDFPDRFVNRP